MSVLEALGWLLVGAFISGAVQFGFGQYIVFREINGIALALAAELNALLMLARGQGYLEGLDRIVRHLADRNRPIETNLEDYFGICVTQDYFTVFNAVSPKLGLLGRLGGEVVETYSLIKSFFEDTSMIKEACDARVRNEPNLLHNPVYLLVQTQGARAKLELCINRRVIVDQLKGYANRSFRRHWAS